MHHPKRFWRIKINIYTYWQQLENWKLLSHSIFFSIAKREILQIWHCAGYGLAASGPFAFDPVILGLSTLGVGLTSAAANATNQTMEVPFDSQMNRTRNRVLVKGLLTPWHAMSFATVSAVGGAVLLWNFVNPISSVLAVANLFLYTLVYTPMKRSVLHAQKWWLVTSRVVLRPGFIYLPIFKKTWQPKEVNWLS